MVVAGTGSMAAATTGLAVGAGPDKGFDTRLFSALNQFDGLINEALERMDKVE